MQNHKVLIWYKPTFDNSTSILEILNMSIVVKDYPKVVVVRCSYELQCWCVYDQSNP
jgi:hypothetical protein